jgi:hypothetical protein
MPGGRPAPRSDSARRTLITLSVPWSEFRSRFWAVTYSHPPLAATVTPIGSGNPQGQASRGRAPAAGKGPAGSGPVGESPASDGPATEGSSTEGPVAEDGSVGWPAG